MTNKHLISAVVLGSAAALLLTGCKVDTSALPDAGTSPTAGPTSVKSGLSGSGRTPAPAKSTSHGSTGSSETGSSGKGTPSTGKSATKSASATGPRIVYFRVKQKPKCAEGTAVFRAKAVPLIIEWKISGATGGALSVDDASHTPGTYGPVELKGTEEFGFTCAGPTGTVEKHTYAIYTVGGGKQRSKTITVKAKVLDKGLGADN